MRYLMLLVIVAACITACGAEPINPLFDKYFHAGETMSASKLNNLVGRIDALDAARLESLSRAEFATAASDQYRFRVATVGRLMQLERKVKGMQRQITILHAKLKAQK